MKTFNNSNPYTATENTFLRNHYRFLTNRHLGKIIGRTPDAIRKQLKVLALERTHAENAVLVHSITDCEVRITDGLPIIWVCIGGSWTEYHVYYWRKLGYRIPVGNRIEFCNEDTLDIRYANLKLVADQDHVEYAFHGRVAYDLMTNDSVRKHQRKSMFSVAMSTKRELKIKKREEVQQVRREEVRQREVKWSQSLLAEQTVIQRDATVGKKPLRIDHRTVIFIPADADPETYRMKHQHKSLKR